MPISLSPISRRRFLAGSAAAVAALAWGRRLPGAAPEAECDPNRFALFSDTHVAADPAAVERGVNMFDHLKQACADLLKAEPRPAALLVNGDCAFLTGQPGDYQTFLRLLGPVREAGVPIHLALGNHDHRERFWQAVPPAPPAERPVEQRQVLRISSPRADWLILDSLDKTNATPGLLGEPQIQWLAKALDEAPDKPALVVVHHDPVEKPKPGGKISGLIDTPALMNVISPRKRVKALFYGHTHNWAVDNRDGLHFINFPPVAYVFKPGKPAGWVDAHVGEAGMTIELRCLDPKHPDHGQKHELTWRK